MKLVAPVEPEVEPGHDDYEDGGAVDVDEVVAEGPVCGGGGVEVEDWGGLEGNRGEY